MTRFNKDPIYIVGIVHGARRIQGRLKIRTEI